MSTAELADSLLERPVIVFGSLPPSGRDLDLLARQPECEALTAGLAAKGFLPLTSVWARFDGCSVESVEVISAAEWQLPADELDALYEQARPIDGLLHLTRPAPKHALLIAARRLVHGDGTLDPKQRARIAEAAAEDPSSWARARDHAAAWGARKALTCLERSYEEKRPLTRQERAAAVRELRLASGASLARAGRRVKRRLTRKTPVVAFSGLDGSGKSTQAQALRNLLEHLGFDVAVVWTRLSYNPVLDVIAYPIKRTLHRSPEGGTSAAKQLRQRSELVTQVWATIVALANVSAQRRSARQHRRLGRIVLCDRYVLDSIVQLRHTYGEGRSFAAQIALMRSLTMRPTAAFFLDVPPETALGRKPDDFGQEELAAQARLYREEALRLGVHTLDGERPREELCEEIARRVWRALG